MWKNILEPAGPHMTLWRMRFSCWITKAINTRSEYVIVKVFFHFNDDRTHALQCYVVRTFPVLFMLNTKCSNLAGQIDYLLFNSYLLLSPLFVQQMYTQNILKLLNY